jgi:hypothetical protein
VIHVFVEELDLAALGFSGVNPETTGRASYHASVLLKLYRILWPPSKTPREIPIGMLSPICSKTSPSEPATGSPAEWREHVVLPIGHRTLHRSFVKI